MNRLLNHKMWGEYSSAEWVCVKISVAFIWLSMVALASINHSSIPYPTGIFSIVDAPFLAAQYTVPVFFISAVMLSILYIFEKRMFITTLLMFVISLILFTLEESNGVLNRNGLYTMLFLAQAIAYYRNTARLSEERIQFPIQIIAGGYVLAGISKIKMSGLGWVTDAPMVSIQILKGYCYTYFNTGDFAQLKRGEEQANFFLHHTLLIKSLFAGSLLLELFAWVSVKNKLRAFTYGLLLTSMHLAIKHFMNVLIVSIFFPMFIFMVNPLYFVYRLVSKLFVLVIPRAEAAGEPLKPK